MLLPHLLSLALLSQVAYGDRPLPGDQPCVVKIKVHAVATSPDDKVTYDADATIPSFMTFYPKGDPAAQMAQLYGKQETPTVGQTEDGEAIPQLPGMSAEQSQRVWSMMSPEQRQKLRSGLAQRDAARTKLAERLGGEGSKERAALHAFSSRADAPSFKITAYPSKPPSGSFHIVGKNGRMDRGIASAKMGFELFDTGNGGNLFPLGTYIVNNEFALLTFMDAKTKLGAEEPLFQMSSKALQAAWNAKEAVTVTGQGHYSRDGGDSHVDMTSFITIEFPERKLEAVPGGPYEVTRGDKVELDGSQSKGNPTRYLWTVYPRKCPMPPSLNLSSTATPDPNDSADVAAVKQSLLPETAEQQHKEGPKWKFTALCDMDAKLEVWDAEGNHKDASVTVTVQPRPGWHYTVKTTDPNNPTPLTGPFENTAKMFGINRCSVHGAMLEEGMDHWIHLTDGDTSGTPTSWTVREVKDDKPGPFEGWWYVESQSLLVSRKTFINAQLLPGSEVHKHNDDAGLGGVLDAIVESNKRHEGLHTKLIQRAAGQSGVDPAVDLEMRAASSKDRLLSQTRRDLALGNSRLKDSVSSEPLVKSHLCGDEAFNGASAPGHIEVPKHSDDFSSWTTFAFDAICQIGDN